MNISNLFIFLFIVFNPFLISGQENNESNYFLNYTNNNLITTNNHDFEFAERIKREFNNTINLKKLTILTYGVKDINGVIVKTKPGDRRHYDNSLTYVFDDAKLITESKNENFV